MSKQRKPKVIVNCVANHYTGPNERIIEFTFPSGEGGLISLRTTHEGASVVDVYNYDRYVQVLVGERKEL